MTIKEMNRILSKYYAIKVNDWILKENIFSECLSKGKKVKWWESLWWGFKSRIKDFRIWLGEKIAGETFETYD